MIRAPHAHHLTPETRYNSLCAGDPYRADPRYGAAGAAVCGYDAADLAPRIPALPLSYKDAAPLLAALGGAAAPEGFAGALPLTCVGRPTTTIRAARPTAEAKGGVYCAPFRRRVR